METTLVTHVGQQAPSPKVIVNKATGTEANRQIDGGQHENDKIERPTGHSCWCQEQQNA